jgi:iron(III) transport system permease protein
MATAYIIGRVENNDYGLAIAYSTVMIFVMLAAVGLLQLLILKGGKKRLSQL